MGSRDSDRVTPIMWKSRLIKQVCHAPKDAETKNTVTVVDLARHAANQIGEMLNQKVGVKIFTDSLATLESIASTHQVQRRLMRASIGGKRSRKLWMASG